MKLCICLELQGTKKKAIGIEAATFQSIGAALCHLMPMGVSRRYDDLVSLYGKRKVRAVGFSVGIDRLLQTSPTTITDEEASRTTEIEVGVATTYSVTKRR